MNPVTFDEWRIYIAELPDSELFSQAVGANTLAFVDALKEEGQTPKFAVSILSLFADALSQRNLAVPTFAEGQYLSYSDLLVAVSG
jgi:hypothetical protein